MPLPRAARLAPLLLSALMSFSVQASAQVLVRMGSSSMAPTLVYGAPMEVNVLAYVGALPARWEIVTFKALDGNYVLNYRVVGLPGDTVSYSAMKILSINGIAATLSQTDLNIPTDFEEEQVFLESWNDERHFIKTRAGAPVVMSEGIEAFPDRNSCSYTHEGFSCVVPPAKYFVMGDNRDSSRDSRYRGFIPIENILGRVENALVLPARR